VARESIQPDPPVEPPKNLKKRVRSVDEEEETLELRPPTRRRLESENSAESTFNDFIRKVQEDFHNERLSAESAVQTILTFLDGKGPVQSDTVESTARKALMKVKASESSKRSAKLVEALFDSLFYLDWCLIFPYVSSL